MSTRGHSFYFFLTPAEQVAVLESFEAHHNRSYYCTDTSTVPDVPAISSLVVESLRHLAIGDWIHSPDYLLTHPDEGIVVREISLRKGGYAYPVDQLLNPELARFKPSGQFGDTVLVAGFVTTFSCVSYSGLLFRALVKLIKQRSRRIGMFWVGPEAEEKLRLGWRLVTNASSPREYDLTLE